MSGNTDILETMIGESLCWSLVLDLTSEAASVLRYIEMSYLFFWPTIRVFIIGSKRDMETTLQNTALRNTLKTYYLSLDERTITTIRGLPSGVINEKSISASNLAKKLAQKLVDFTDVVNERTEIYFRCMYCKNGHAGIERLQNWNLADTLGPVSDFPDETRNFHGHQFDIVCKKRIPLTDIDKNWGGPEGTVGPLDSLDVRINYAISGKLNFTYLLREPWDNEWGLLGPGRNFSGVVGTLQYEKADFSFMLTATPGRTRVMDYSRVYAGDPYVIVSSKPKALPRYLAIVKPFTAWVWNSIIITCLFAGVMLWMIEKVRCLFSRVKTMSLTTSLLYTVRMVLLNPPVILPTQLASQFLLGIWWVGCLVIFTAYRSALIAHLTVVIRSSAINTFEDLYNMEGQRWGWIEYSGTAIAYLAENPDPIVQEIYKKLEIHPLEKQMDLVLAGYYSHVTRKTIVWVDFLKAERRGLPVYMSTTEYPVFGGYGWGFRKGAPFRDAIDRMKQRLIEAGLIDRWLNEVIRVQVEESEKKEFNGSLIIRQADEKEQSALSLEHLQGSFYLLLIGYWIAGLVLVLEIARHYYMN
ncbi:glutamate receptor ionotropic, delta-2-like [Palaemon carinicauda]|uniref:glutamate receptor ionotropic, delta-2-like n=1 Tax=Palaemon carinicauda TaxID=392227 RepID=UPI0035B66495